MEAEGGAKEEQATEQKELQESAAAAAAAGGGGVLQQQISAMSPPGGCSGALLMRSYSGENVIRRRLSRTVKEQRARFYIMRRCVHMLLCWRDDY